MKSFSNGKILIIRLSSIGDIVLTTALLRMIRKAYPKNDILYITDKNYSSILTHNMHITEVIDYDKSYSPSQTIAFAKELNKNISDNDIIIDLHNNFRTFLIKNFLKAKSVSLDKNRIFKLILTLFRKNIYGKNLSIPQLYFDTALKALEITDDLLGLEFWLESDKSARKYLPLERTYIAITKPNIVIAPGATYMTKRWLPENFLKVAEMMHDKYDASISLIGGKPDSEICNYIENNCTSGELKNYCGQFNLEQSAQHIRNSDLLLSNDTGMMHISAAMQTPVVAVFGSSVRDFGFEPYRSQNTIVETILPCRPCSHIGRNSCPKKHFKCMKSIKPEDVAAEIVRTFRK